MLSDHMKDLWKKVGFVPTTFELDNNDNDDMENDSVIRDSKFPPGYERPDPTNRDIEQYKGIVVKNIPNRIGEDEILDLLINHGLPASHPKNNMKLNKNEKNTTVIIDD